tara:strand:+ start:3927 stop:4445 length:519 start_codon:yes stop_codon:yes gene_type:complete
MVFKFVKSTHEKWATFLEIAHHYGDLMETGMLIKNGGYYARQKETKKRGYKAFQEVMRMDFGVWVDQSHLTEPQLENMLLLLMLCKSPPVVICDTLKFVAVDFVKIQHTHHALKDIEVQEEPFEIEIEEISPVIHDDEKLTSVMAVVDSLDFTIPQLLKLMSLLNNKTSQLL